MRRNVAIQRIEAICAGPAMTQAHCSQLLAEVRRAAPDTELIAALCNEVGVARRYAGDLDAAMDLYQVGLELLDLCDEPESDGHATLQHNLGGLHHALGDLPAAHIHLEAAVRLRRRSSGRSDGTVLRDQAALAAVLSDMGDLTRADQLLESVLHHLRGEPVLDLDEIGTTLHNLGVLAWRRGDQNEAVRLLNEASDCKRRSGDVEPFSIASTLLCLARIHQNMDRPTLARLLARRADAVLTPEYGCDHPLRRACDALGEP